MSTHNEQQWQRWAQDRDERMNEMRHLADSLSMRQQHIEQLVQEQRERASGTAAWTFVVGLLLGLILGYLLTLI